MRKILRKALKFILPFGIVEVVQNRRLLREWGRRLGTGEWWRSDWLVHEARTTGLDLFPPAHWPKLHTIIDVGANVGQWSSMLLDLITPRKLVIIEPEPGAFAELQRHFGGRANVELHHAAIGDVNGVTRFHITRDSTGASVLRPRPEMRELVGGNWSVESEIAVPLTTLDTLLDAEGEISLLKIDVQGFERQVLAGASRCLARTNFLLVELNYMRQYVGGSWFGEIHEVLTRDYPFALVDASKPLRLNGRASMSDGLYVNTARLPEFAQRDFW
ncbi:MAG: FkbM family methyltransferase [Chthoniobacterales bacterium]